MKPCPACGYWEQGFYPAGDACSIIDQLIAAEGNQFRVAKAYALRHGATPKGADRLLRRIRTGEVAKVTARTYDRLWVML